LKLLVTGAAGFIGSHLVDRLLNTGYQVSGIDNFDSFYNPKIKEKNISRALESSQFKLFRRSILNKSELDRIFSQEHFDLVIHLAAKAGVRPSIQDPTGYFQVNAEGTLNLLELCRKHHIGKFIFGSSSSVYGNNKKIPFSEQDPVDHPISPYAASKKSAELICHNYYHLYKINIFILRFFTVYGPRQRPDLAIHKFFKLINANKPIPIFGNGETYRDYTYIDDIIDGILKSIKKVKGYEIINLGESEPIKLKNLIKLIEKTVGQKVEKQYLDKQPGDVNKTYADIEKAKKLLKYHPSTHMEEGLRQFYDWFKNNIY